METVMEILISQEHPEYTKDEIWQEIMRFCDDNSMKIRLVLKRYRFETATEAFEEKRQQMMSLLCSSHDDDVQWMVRFVTNTELAILYLLGEKNARDTLFWNITRLLEQLISGEAYTIVKKIELNEQLCEKVLDKVNGLLLSDEILTRKKERWEVVNCFDFDQTCSKKSKEWTLRSKLPMHGIGNWHKRHEPFEFTVKSIYLADDFGLEWHRKFTDLMYDGEYEEGLKVAYQYSKLCKGRASFYSSGLVFDENGDIVFLTYVFRQAKEGKKIYRCKHELAHFPETVEDRMDKESLCEVSQKDFMKFCRMLYKKEFD